MAAEILYERFKPMVEEQLASSPFAKVAFTVSTQHNGHERLLTKCCMYMCINMLRSCPSTVAYGAACVVWCDGKQTCLVTVKFHNLCSCYL